MNLVPMTKKILMKMTETKIIVMMRNALHKKMKKNLTRKMERVHKIAAAAPQIIHSSNVKTCLRNPTNCTNKIPSQPTISTKQGQTSKKSKKKTYQGDLAQRKKVRRNKKRNANDMHINQETMMPSQPKQNIPDQTSVLTKKQKKKARKTRRRAKNKLKREETALPTRIHSPYIIQPSFNNNILPYINLVNNIAQSQMIYNHQLNVSINSNSNQQRR